MIKRLVTLIISPLMLISLFIIPVYANNEDYTYLAIDRESYSAYEYFQQLGASLTDVDINTTYHGYLSGTVSACISVPSTSQTYTEQQGNAYWTSNPNYTMTMTGCSAGADNIVLTNYDSDRVRYVKPSLVLTNYTAPSSYTSNQALMIRAGSDFVLGLEITTNLATDSVGILTQNNDNILISEVRLVEYNAPWRRYRIVLHSYVNSGWTYFNLTFPSMSNAKFTPLYLGHLDNMSDDMGRLLGYPTGVARLIEDGNNESQASSSQLESQNTTFGNSSSTLFNFENSFTGQMDDAMNDINLTTSGGLLSVSGFTNALVWVVNQFNSLISPAPITGALLLMLTFGLAMYLVGMK